MIFRFVGAWIGLSVTWHCLYQGSVSCISLNRLLELFEQASIAVADVYALQLAIFLVAIQRRLSVIEVFV
jgi:hypothetical protein